MESPGIEIDESVNIVFIDKIQPLLIEIIQPLLTKRGFLLYLSI